MMQSIWGEEAIEAIHDCSLGLLETVGLRVDLQEAREILLHAGCKETPEGRLAVPRQLVEESLAACPPSFTLLARDPARSLLIDAEPGPTYVHGLRGVNNVVDPLSGQRRPSTLKDVYEHARVMHGLPQQDAITELFEAGDVHIELQSLYFYLATARETDKYIRGPAMLSPFQARHMCQMAEVLAGSRAGSGTFAMEFAYSPVSPLFIDADCSQALIQTVRRGGIAIECMPCPVAGTTAPASLSGAVATQNAEILGVIALIQACSPGTPTYYSARVIAADPRTGGCAAGGPEMGLMSMAAVILARRYGLACDCYGPSGSSMVVDSQFGFENALNTLLGLAARPRLLGGCGDMHGGLSSSKEILVIDDEIVNYCRYVLSSHRYDARALDVDAIAEGILNPRGFLSTKHTREFMRTDLLTPELSWRGGLGAWLESEYTSLVDCARERADELLSRPPVGLPDDIDERMCAVIDSAAAELGLGEWPDPRESPDGLEPPTSLPLRRSPRRPDPAHSELRPTKDPR
jgi:trimethylamine---corrinoid protein Co-methyltransferase